MKKSFLKIFVTAIAGCNMFVIGNMPSVQAIDNTKTTMEEKGVIAESAYSEVRKIEFGNSLEYVMKFNYFPEYVRSTKANGDKIYSRFVTAVGTLYKNDKNLTKKLLEHKVNVAFTYDKKSLVEIHNCEDDIECSTVKLDKSNKKWKMAQTHEILYDDGICIVSEMLTVFKKHNITNRIQYIENSHIDFICTPQGNIIINCKSMN